jgi:hypothetical protein
LHYLTVGIAILKAAIARHAKMVMLHTLNVLSYRTVEIIRGFTLALLFFLFHFYDKKSGAGYQ